MHDQHSRQALMDALKNRVEKASSTVSTKIEAEEGDFKVVISENSIDQFYKTQNEFERVGTLKVANFDDETIEMINENANDAAKELLDNFASTFNVNAFVAKSENNKPQKQAAHETQDEDTYQMVTQKQFDDQKPDLHPRTDDYYRTITQKQLPDEGQRPGTYDIITEGQMRDETTTFYNDPLEAGKRLLEDRNVVTEAQFDKGAKEWSEVGQSDRAQTGSKIDGDLDAQVAVINEKQILELLKHHEWTEPLNTTEGDEQLGGQDSEIGRLTAETAPLIIKESLNALAKTVLAAGVTPDRLASIVQRLISHPSKYPVLAQTIKQFNDKSTQAIDAKVAKARYFGKVANAKDQEWSDGLIADVLIRQLAKTKHSTSWIVKSLVAMTDEKGFTDKINKTADQILENKTDQGIADGDLNIFQNALNGKDKTATVKGTANNDGLYEYTGLLEEVKANVDDKDAFMKEAAEIAKTQIKVNTEDKIELVPEKIHVDKEAGLFRIRLKDTSFKLNDDELKARAEKRRELAKIAETKEAQVGGAGGMPPAAGPEMGNPGAPPGGGDMGGAPPGEALQTPGLGDEELGAPEGTGEPQPPGSICPVCGSNDVDVDNGEFRCNNCGAEGTVHVNLDVAKWPETIKETEIEEEGFGIGAEEAGMGVGEEGDLVEEGAGTTMPNVPIAASIRITPLMLEKIAEQKITIGSVCPNCGGHNTDLAKSATAKGKHGICWDCMQEYNFQIRADRKKKHRVYAQYSWTPNHESAFCSNCTRLKTAFMNSLDNYGMKWEKFNSINMREQGDLIIKMANANALDLSEGMKAALPFGKYAASPRWRGYGKFDKFPSASCMERISRRFGENATAMSGPCQGKPLAKCICAQLEGLGIYTDGLAAKVASTIVSKDPMEHSPTETCVQMFVREGYPVKQACTACDGLRAAYATTEDLMIEAIAQFDPLGPKPMRPKPMPGAPKPMPAPTNMHDPAVKPWPKPMAAPGAPKPMPGAPKPVNQMLNPEAIPGPQGAPIDPAGADPMAVNPAVEAKPMEMAQDPAAMSQDPAAPIAPVAPSPAAPVEMGAKPMMGGMPGGGGGMPGGGGGMPGGGGGMSPMEMGGMDEEMDPLDIPVIDGGGGFGGGMEEDIGANLDLGGDDMVTIEVPAEAAAIIEQLVQVMSGGIEDDMIDMGGHDDMLGMGDEDLGGDLDVGDVSDIVDNNEDELDILDDDDHDHDHDGDDDHDDGDGDGHGDGDGIPGLSEDSDNDDDLIKETGDMEKKEMGKSMESNSCPTCGQEASSCGHLVKEAETKETETQEITKEARSLDHMLFRMKQGAISRQGDAIDNLIEGLLAQNPSLTKEAIKTEGGIKTMERTSVKENKIKETAAQDTTGIGTIKNDGKIGHESKFTEDISTSPDVPRAAATLGEEGSEVTVSESGDLPTVPHGSPAMAGEEHYLAEKGNLVDGNQGGGPMTSASEQKEKTVKMAEKTKTAGCDCGTDDVCSCGSGKCDACCGCDKACNTASVKYTIKPGHKIYDKLSERLAKGKQTVKLADKTTYQVIEYDKNYLLVPEKNAQNSEEIKKESQTVSPKSVNKLEDDPDLNPSSGPGAGKTHADEKHSLGVDEKKPSEGMSEPTVPSAPNSGQLAREHTVDNKLDGPSIPAGGGMNPEYDQNEKNTPEKQDQILGKENDIAAMAETRKRATKIAGQLLKANKINLEELSDKIAELSAASPAILTDYENMMNEKKEASTKKGLQKDTSGIESPIQSTTSAREENKSDLKDSIQGLFRLDQRNRDHEKYAGTHGDSRLFR